MGFSASRSESSFTAPKTPPPRSAEDDLPERPESKPPRYVRAQVRRPDPDAALSQRNSGYERKPRDEYNTPAWVTRALLPHLPSGLTVWEPACGSGGMAEELRLGGHTVHATDIVSGCDFLAAEGVADAIVTNPPYGLAQRFIEHALRLSQRYVAMLLRTDYDHARTRQHLFSIRHSQRSWCLLSGSCGSTTPVRRRPSITLGTFGTGNTAGRQYSLISKCVRAG
jgi:hypothetical protein